MTSKLDPYAPPAAIGGTSATVVATGRTVARAFAIIAIGRALQAVALAGGSWVSYAIDEARAQDEPVSSFMERLFAWIIAVRTGQTLASVAILAGLWLAARGLHGAAGRPLLAGALVAHACNVAFSVAGFATAMLLPLIFSREQATALQPWLSFAAVVEDALDAVSAGAIVLYVFRSTAKAYVRLLAMATAGTWLVVLAAPAATFALRAGGDPARTVVLSVVTVAAMFAGSCGTAALAAFCARRAAG